LANIVNAATGPEQLPAERVLLERLADCFHAYQALNPLDREQVRTLLMTITGGMIHDLRVFPGENEGKLAALESLEELDRYTYAVAGCVGEFWTHLHVAHRPRFTGWDVGEMSQLGVRFGKGLQLTNVLRDLSHDLRIGRCYLPRQELGAIGLSPEDLLEPANLGRLKPLLRQLLGLTLGQYQAGWAYTMAVPRREWRTRLACAWPLLIGLKTLSRIAGAENLLDPSVTITISRQSVYGLLARSGLLVASNRGLTALYQRLFDRSQRALLAESP
jgi:farnesyl-diphosphate farnesyltransferase